MKVYLNAAVISLVHWLATIVEVSHDHNIIMFQDGDYEQIETDEYEIPLATVEIPHNEQGSSSL